MSLAVTTSMPAAPGLGGATAFLTEPHSLASFPQYQGLHNRITTTLSASVLKPGDPASAVSAVVFAGGFVWYLNEFLVKHKGSFRHPALLGVLFASSGPMGVEAAAIGVNQDDDSGSENKFPETTPARRPVPRRLLEVRQKGGCAAGDDGDLMPFCDRCGGGVDHKGKDQRMQLCKEELVDLKIKVAHLARNHVSTH